MPREIGKDPSRNDTTLGEPGLDPSLNREGNPDCRKMILAFRIIIIVVSLLEAVGCYFLVAPLRHLGNAFGGSGDGAGAQGNPNADTLMIVLIWLIATVPYWFMLLGAFNLIKGNLLRLIFPGLLAVLVITTSIELVTRQRLFDWMAVGNVIAAVLFACILWGRGKT
jgi:hypothetical protein